MNNNCWLYDKCNHRDCNSVCMRYVKLNYLYNSANISMSQRKHLVLTTEADEQQFIQLKEIENNIVEFVNRGETLYIHSQQAGNGKTSWSLRLVQAYLNQIWATSPLTCRALFINVPKFLLALKDNISEKNEYVEHIKDNIDSADIVVWDDIATKTVTTFEAENLFSMIDNRINLGKANIFTSNLSDEETHNALGDRLCSRICQLGTNIVLYGKDKRRLTNLNK